jgi:NAD(P)-dependent dehydrogenase (short-subunit alcohol dehydrogenase family)
MALPFTKPAIVTFIYGRGKMKHVVITGCTRGIGFGLAKEFLKRGCKVVISGRSEKSVTKAVRELSRRARMEG